MNETPGMTDGAGEAVERAKLRIEEEKLAIERERLALDRSFWKKQAPIVAVFVVAVLTAGQVAVAWIQKDRELVTTAIQKDKELKLAHQRNVFGIKTEQLRRFAVAYQQNGNALNGWCVHVLRLAKQQVKPAAARDVAAIQRVNAEIAKLQDEFRKGVPIESELALIASMFSSPRVRTTAQSMRSTWLEFEKLMQATNQGYNEGTLSADKIESLDGERTRLKLALEELKDQLLGYMASEIETVAS